MLKRTLEIMKSKGSIGAPAHPEDTRKWIKLSYFFTTQNKREIHSFEILGSVSVLVEKTCSKCSSRLAGFKFYPEEFLWLRCLISIQTVEVSKGTLYEINLTSRIASDIQETSSATFKVHRQLRQGYALQVGQNWQTEEYKHSLQVQNNNQVLKKEFRKWNKSKNILLSY